tara:strand:- start:259 stop:462 length:204 start_codon:yes stop_codon:yes gene_type:complete
LDLSAQLDLLNRHFRLTLPDLLAQCFPPVQRVQLAQPLCYLHQRVQLALPDQLNQPDQCFPPDLLGR